MAGCETSPPCAPWTWSPWKTHRGVVHHEGEAVHEILHAWGTNGIITRIWLALTPSVEWGQCAVAFDTFDQAFDFSERIATSEEWTKRLVTTFEWPIPSFFSPVRTLAPEGKALIFFMIAEEQRTSLETAAREAGGAVTFSAPYKGLRTVPLLSDYTWNHTTLWAMKSDPEYTYLQCGFDAVAARSQFARLKQRFGDEFLLHLEFIKNAQGVVFPGAIPVVRFTTEKRLNEMIDYCREIGVSVANPHVNNVEGGGRYRSDNVQLLAKHKYDTKGLLNPGKMVDLRTARRRSAHRMKSWIPDARNFAYLTWKQVDALSRETTVLVLPTAAIEQHGQHLPLATDTLINSILLGAALARLPQEIPVYALPAVCYGKSNEHIGFPGTLSVSASTFMAVLRDLGASIAASGFKKLVLYNTHGGNSSLVDVMARDLRAEFGLRVFSLFGSGGRCLHRARRTGAYLWFPRRRSGNLISAQRHTGAGSHRRVHRELHRGYCQAGDIAAGKCSRELCLAHEGYCAQRGDGRSQPGQRAEGHALD